MENMQAPEDMTKDQLVDEIREWHCSVDKIMSHFNDYLAAIVRMASVIRIIAEKDKIMLGDKILECLDSIEAQTALNRAVDLAIGRKDLVPDLVTLCNWQGHFKTLLQTGAVDPMALAAPMPIGEQQATDPNQDDSDLPPELRADYQG